MYSNQNGRTNQTTAFTSRAALFIGAFVIVLFLVACGMSALDAVNDSLEKFGQDQTQTQNER